MFSLLNPQQASAVKEINSGCLVLAGAGSGKTRVLLQKIMYLLTIGKYPPQKILAITFTQQAANELKQRLFKEGKEKKVSVKEVFVGTFHAYALALLRRHKKELGAQSRLLLCSEPDKLHIIQEVLGDLSPSQKNLEVINEISAQISLWKNFKIDPEQAIAQSSQALQSYAKIYKKYDEHLQKFGWVDFEDLLQLTLRLFKKNPVCLEEEKERCQYLLIDEFQDTNPLQWELAQQLICKEAFTIVGDDDQAIYGWRGADPKILQEVTNKYPNLVVIKLEKSYRCTIPIITVANRAIKNNTHLFKKTLSSERLGENIKVVCLPDAETEAEWIVSQIYEHRQKRAIERIAILYRSHHQARIIKKACQEKKIECIVIGEDELLDKPEARLIFDYWMVISDRECDTNLLRIINTPRRGIGPSTLQRASEWAQKHQKSFWNTLISFGFLAQLKDSERQAVEKFTQWILEQQKKIHHLESNDGHFLWVQYFENLIKELDLEKHLANGASEKFFFVRRQRLYKICTLLLSKLKYSKAEKFPNGNFSIALSKLEPSYKDLDEKFLKKETPVFLMTFHASKGLEFDSVYLCGLEQGILPHRNATNEAQIQEERRLFYVGLTRARTQLTLTYARSRAKYSQGTTADPSPFLNEISGEEIETEILSSEIFHQARANTAKKYLDQLRENLKNNLSSPT